ncbi:MAG TPA: 2-oxoglutarate dehydrogenase complex dihydrolipoyllysine-residue succinyltransferase [Kiritimatiellia bacterium]|nr:2-oxoglutarate dehydrogenase complex dihydrolipoyllysine-residue succinyltransferase [Kiritimatiellia bacterium]
MIKDVLVPNFPESIQEGTLSSWAKNAGDSVQKNEKIADIETDKIVIEVTAPLAGTLKTLAKKEGDTVKSREVIARIEASEGAETAEADADTEAEDSAPAPAKPAPARPAPGDAEEDRTPEEDAVSKATPAAPPSRKPKPIAKLDLDLAPAVRKLIADNNLNAEEIHGTGRGGRITKADVIRHLEHSPHLATKFGAHQETASESAAPAPATPRTPAADNDALVRRVKMSRIRARIAERLVHAQQNMAILTTFNEVNMQAIIDLRQRQRDAFEKTHKVKLGFMAFFVKAAVEALQKYPVINAYVEGDEIIYNGTYHIGVAVSSDRGLVVPVLRNANQLTIAQIERGIADFADRAQQGKLDIEELSGGTFTISNGGVFGSLLSTPIINPPQSGILGMHRIQERPVAEDGNVVIRPMMYLALSYDHRIIDGREAVQFLVSIKQSLEDPARLLLHL